MNYEEWLADRWRMPSYRSPNVMHDVWCMMYQLQEGVVRATDIVRIVTKWKSTKVVLAEVSIFYGKAIIPMISEHKACERIIKLLDDNAKMRSIPCERRPTPHIMSRLQQKMLTAMRRWQQPLPLWSMLHEITIALFALKQLPSFLTTLLNAPNSSH